MPNPSITSLWASRTSSFGRLPHDAIMLYLRRRKDLPGNFTHKTHLREFLDKIGCTIITDTAIDELWQSYREFRDRMKSPNLETAGLPLSYTEARRLGMNRFRGPVCNKDPSHGDVKRISGTSYWCEVCRRDYTKNWLKMQRNPERMTVDVDPLEEGIDLAELMKVSNRRQA